MRAMRRLEAFLLRRLRTLATVHALRRPWNARLSLLVDRIQAALDGLGVRQ